MLRRAVAMLALLGSLSASALELPAGWVRLRFPLPACPSGRTFETVEETRDTAGQVRALHFSRDSLMDAYQHLYVTFDGLQKLRHVRWSIEGDWDYSVTTWTLDGRGRVLTVHVEGIQSGEHFDMTPAPSRLPLPGELRLRPSQAVYRQLACTPLIPTPLYSATTGTAPVVAPCRRAGISVLLPPVGLNRFHEPIQSESV